MIPTALNKSLDNALSKNSVATYAQELTDRKAAEAKNRYLSKEEIEKKIRMQKGHGNSCQRPRFYRSSKTEG
jgi:excinuclease ABC subunit B